MDEVRAREARASFARMIHRLRWETHPILGQDVCALEHDGDFVFLDRDDIDRVSASSLDCILNDVLPSLDHLPDLRLERACQQLLARDAVLSTPNPRRHS